jgi:hypothetical protein
MAGARKHIRFEAEDKTFITLKFDEDSIHGGLGLSESTGGCSGVFKNVDKFFAGVICEIKVGKLEPMQAEIRWVEELDKDIIKVGFQYILSPKE